MSESEDALPGIPAGQTEPESSSRLDHLASDLQKPKPELLHLHRGKLRLVKGLPEPQDEPVGCHVQEESELVGKETMTTEPICFESVLELVDPHLAGAAPLDVELIEIFWFMAEVGHDKATVRSLRQPLGLHHYPTLL